MSRPRSKQRGKDRGNRVISPVGLKGLDLFTAPDLLDEDRLVLAENVRMQTMEVVRRNGMVGLKYFTPSQDAAGSYDIEGTGGIIIPHAAQHLIPVGPWALRASFVATRPAANPTGHDGVMVVGTEYTDASDKVPYGIELADDGTVTGKFTDTGNTVHKVQHVATAAEDSVWLLVWDPSTTSLTLYQDGASVHSISTGTATTQPLQGTGQKLYIGVASEDGSAFEANSNFEDKIDEVLMWSWPGRNINTNRANGRSLLDTILRHNLRSWPDYLDPSLVFAYPLDSFGTTARDLSRFKNDGAVTGCSSAAGLTRASMPGQLIRSHDKTNGGRALYVQAGGETFVVTLRGKTA